MLPLIFGNSDVMYLLWQLWSCSIRQQHPLQLGEYTISPSPRALPPCPRQHCAACAVCREPLHSKGRWEGGRGERLIYTLEEYIIDGYEYISI